MNKQDRVATLYSNAKELIKSKNPRAARAYVVEILNEALESYRTASSYVSKARTAAFMERWIAVSRDLYDKGITDYVLECFGLYVPPKPVKPAPKAKKESPAAQKPKEAAPALPQKPAPKAPEKPKVPEKPKPLPPQPSAPDEIDIAGLVDDASKTQGWCAEVFEANKSAVVAITVSSQMHGASGTGFIISEKGYLLTNDHVVFDEACGGYYSKVFMSFVGEKKTYKLEVLFSDSKADIALCRFNPAELPAFTSVKRIADYTRLKQGADCLVIGNAFGMGLAPFTGIIRFTKNDVGNMVYTAPSNPGDSGGPVFNRNGECIGINKSKTVAFNGTAAEAYANATPMDKIDELLKKWTSHNNITL